MWTQTECYLYVQHTGRRKFLINKRWKRCSWHRWRKKFLAVCQKTGKKYLFFLLFGVWDVPFSYSFLFWGDAGKAECRCLERVLLFSCTHPLCLCEVCLPHREKEQGPGSCRVHWQAFTAQRTSHCGSVVIWTSAILCKFIKSIIAVNQA